MSHLTLHYLYDPLCGWCYGAAPLIQIAREMAPVIAHAGGLMVGDARRPVTPKLAKFVKPHDRNIAQLSGQPFGDAYIHGLLNDAGAVFDSEPPITAVLAAEHLAQRGLDLLARLQTAHYVDGEWIADIDVLQALAADIGLDATGFEHAFTQLAGAATHAHIEATRALMIRTRAYGFPALSLERDGIFTPLDITAYFGKPDAWHAWLIKQLADDTAANDAVTSTQGCKP
jgi:putative protein-disulfide isomerase